MAADIADLGFRVDTTGILRADRALTRLENSGRTAGTEGQKAGGLINRSMRNSAGGIGVASRSIGLLRGALAGLGIGSLINTTRNFEAAMNDVEEKLDASVNDMRIMRDTAKEMGATTAFSASQAGEAMGALAQRNLKAGQITKTLPDVLNLASAAQISLADSAKITAGTILQFGLNVDQSRRVVDLFAAAGDKSGTNVSQLAEAMIKAGPRARQWGIQLEETAAMAAVLADNQILGSVAGTGMAAMIARLVTPLGEGAKALDDVGLSAADFIKIADDGSETFIGYANAIEKLNNSNISATNLSRVLGQEAGSSVVSAFNAGADAIRNKERALGEASSAMAQAQTQMKGLPGATKAFASAWESLNIALVGSEGANLLSVTIRAMAGGMRFLATDAVPALQPVIAGLTRNFRLAGTAFLRFREALSSSDALPFVALRALGDAFATVGRAVQPLVPYLDDLVIAMASVAAASTVFAALAAGVGLLTSPLVLIAAFAVAVYQIYENWDGVVAWWSGVWTSIKTTGEEFLAWWRDTTFDQKLIDIGTNAVDFAREKAATFFEWWDGSTLKQITPQIIVDGVERARAAGRGFLQWWDSTTFEEKTTQIQYAVIDQARSAWETFAGLWSSTTLGEKVALIGTTSIETANNIARSFVEWWNTTTLKAYLPTIVTDSIDGALEAIQNFVDWWNTATVRSIVADITFETITRAYEAVQSFVEFWQNLDLKSIILDFEFPTFESLQSGGAGLLDRMRQFGSDIVGGMGDGIARAQDHINATEEMKGDIQLAMAGLPEQMNGVGSDVAAGLAGGLKSGESTVLEAASSMSTGVLGRLRSIFRTQSPSKETQDIGIDVATGLAIGINDGSEDAVEAARVLSDRVLTELESANDPQFSFNTDNVIRPAQFAQASSVADDYGTFEPPDNVQQGDYGLDSAAYTAYVDSMIEQTDRLVESDRKKWSDLKLNEQIGLAGGIANDFLESFKTSVGSYIRLNDNMTEAERASAVASNAINRKRFEENKKWSIAQAIISTITGATRAFAEVPFPANFAASAAIIAAGFKNVSAIRSSSFGGGSASAPGVGNTNTSGNLNPNTVARDQAQDAKPSMNIMVLQSDGQLGTLSQKERSKLLGAMHTAQENDEAFFGKDFKVNDIEQAI